MSDARISSPIRVRSLAKRLGMADDDLLLWLMEHAPGVPAGRDPHPADYLPADLAERARKALGAPPPPPMPKFCHDCLGAAPKGVGVCVSTPADCSRCGGSVNAREAAGLVEAFAAAGMRRLLVVGGGPGTVEDLRALLGQRIEVRIVEGEPNRDGTRAEADLRWCDVAVVWSSTILPHRVSKLYTSQRDLAGRLIVVPVRGVAALCRAAADKARRLPAERV